MYKIIITDYFKKQLKRLVKKNRSLKENLKIALVNFNKEHTTSIGHGVYKMRLQGQTKANQEDTVFTFLVLK